MDLAVWWQARRWRALLELIEQLPVASRFQEAVRNDPEQARLIALDLEYSDGTPQPKQEPWSPRVSEWDLVAILLREIAQNTAAAAGVKKPRYIPDPRTEVDRQRELIVREQARATVAAFGFDPALFG